jgi:hypothetical protein
MYTYLRMRMYAQKFTTWPHAYVKYLLQITLNFL